MQTEYYPNRWLRILDITGMVIAPISFTLPLFFMAIGTYLTASSNGTSFKLAIVLFFGALSILILVGLMFGRGIKLYVNHKATREKVKNFRVGYSLLIFGSLIVDFMLLNAFFFGP